MGWGLLLVWNGFIGAFVDFTWFFILYSAFGLDCALAILALIYISADSIRLISLAMDSNNCAQPLLRLQKCNWPT